MPIIPSSAALALASHTLESGDTKHTIQFTKLPPIEGPGSDRRSKSIAFDSLTQQLRSYAHLHNITTITHALNSVLPTSGQTVQARATEDSKACIDRAIANPDYLEITGFALSTGQLIPLADSPSARPPNIEWMLLRCTLPSGSALHRDLPPSFKARTVTFAMRLPQSAYQHRPPSGTQSIQLHLPWEPTSPPPAISPFRQLYARVTPALTAAWSHASAWFSPPAIDAAATAGGDPTGTPTTAPAPAIAGTTADVPGAGTPAQPLSAPTHADRPTLATPTTGTPDFTPQRLFHTPTFAPILHTYLGPTNPLISWDIFNQVFPPGSLVAPFRHSSSNNTVVYIEESAHGHPVLAQLTESIHLELLIQGHRRNYVGTITICSTDAIKGASAALLALEFDPSASPSASGPATSPAGLYERFQCLFPSFPDTNTHIWGLNFFNTYFNKLPPSLQESIRQDPEFISLSLPGGLLDIYSMSSKRSQEDATASLRDIATRCFDAQQDQLFVIAQQFGLKPLTPQSASKSPRSHHLGPSAAEHTIQTYSQPPFQPASQQPSSQPADYTTRDPDGFPLLLCPQTHPQACLGCYAADHRYNPQDCKLYGVPSAKARLGRNIAHRREIGLLRPKRPDLPRFNSTDWDSNRRLPNSSGSPYGPGASNTGYQSGTTYSNSPPSNGALQHSTSYSTFAAPSGPNLRGINNNPAWLTRGSLHPGNDTLATAPAPAPAPPPNTRRADSQPDGQAPPAKHPRPSIFTIQVHCHHTTSATRALPCAIDNGLPHLFLPLASAAGTIILDLAAMIDSGSAITVGNLPFHLWVFSQYPAAVHSFELSNDPASPFDPLRLQGALAEGTTAPPEHGSLTGVIRYYIASSPDSTHTGSPATVLTVALGSSVNVNTIFGWPSIQALGCDILASQSLVASSVLKHRFSITKRAARCGLPSGITFDTAAFQTSQEFKDLRAALPQETPVQSSDSCFDGFLVRKTIT